MILAPPWRTATTSRMRAISGILAAYDVYVRPSFFLVTSIYRLYLIYSARCFCCRIYSLCSVTKKVRSYPVNFFIELSRKGLCCSERVLRITLKVNVWLRDKYSRRLCPLQTPGFVPYSEIRRCNSYIMF
jgi:hypothetical protein